MTTQAPGVERRWSITVEPATEPGAEVVRRNPPSMREEAYPGPATAESPRRKASARPETATTPEPPGAVNDALRAAADLAERTGSRVTVEYSESIPVTTSTSESTLDDAGAGLDARGAGQATGLDQAGRRVSLPWDRSARASGGGFGLSTEILGGSGVNVLHVLGGLCVIAALIPIVLPPRRIVLAASIAGTGLLLIAAGTVAEEYPWIYAVAIVAFLGVLAWLAYSAWREARKTEALKAVAKGIEEQDEMRPGETAKPLIAMAARKNGTTNIVKDEIGAIKKRLGL